MQAADRVFSHTTLFSAAERFPSPDYLNFPISAEAARYYKYGGPFLQHYLPFWAANLIDPLKLLALPLLALLLPLPRMLPLGYAHELYALRLHIDLLTQQIRRRLQEPRHHAEAL